MFLAAAFYKKKGKVIGLITKKRTKIDPVYCGFFGF